MDLTIVAKSDLSAPRLLNKKQLGADKIEIQLLESFLTEDFDPNKSIELVMKTGVEVCAVHVPIISKINIEIECLKDKKTCEMFYMSCELAERFANCTGKPVLVIMHIGWTMNEFHRNPEILEKTDYILSSVLERSKNIEIGIENIIPIIKRTGFNPESRNGYLFDNVDYAKYFCSKYKTNRVGTVLDTCHALTTIRFFNLLKEHGMRGVDFTLDDYFKNNSELIKLIHLANVKGLGYEPFTHGITFTDNYSDMQLLRTIIDLYFKHSYSCPVTIEVIEKDYDNALNFSQTLSNINRILAEKTGSRALSAHN